MSLAFSNSGATFQAVDRERTRHGLEFGKAMYEYRAQCSAHGNHQGKGFLQLYEKLEPPNLRPITGLTHMRNQLVSAKLSRLQ